MATLALALALLAAPASAAVAPTVPTVRLRNGVELPMVAAGSAAYNSTKAFESVKAALTAGFTMVDTALDYGNEEGVGRGVATVPREHVFVETKVPGCLGGLSTINPFGCEEDTRKNLDEDLRLLNLSYVDLALVHFPPAPVIVPHSCGFLTCDMVRAQWRAMEKFYSEGKARAIGVSNYCPSCFDCLNGTSVFPMVNQVQYHIGMGVDPQGLMSYGRSRGIVTQAYQVLSASLFIDGASPDILKGNITTAIAKAHNRSTVQVALKWVIGQGVPAVTKSSNPKHLAEDLDLWSWDFTDEERSTLDSLRHPEGSPSFACSSASVVVV